MSPKLKKTAGWMDRLNIKDDKVYQTQKTTILTYLKNKWKDYDEFRAMKSEGKSLANQQIFDCIRKPLKSFIGKEMEKKNRDMVESYLEWAAWLYSCWRPSKEDGGQATIRVDGNGSESATTLGTTAAYKQRDAFAVENDQPSIDHFQLSPVTSPRRNLRPRHPVQEEEVTGNDHNIRAESVVIDQQGIIPLPLTSIWDDLDVKVNATELGFGVVWFPMMYLKPERDKQCHWTKFELGALVKTLTDETGLVVDLKKHQFVYDDIIFTNRGAWKTVIRRFEKSMSKPGQREPLYLAIELKEKQQKTSIRTAEKRGLEIEPASDYIPAQSAKRAKSSFTGTTSDYTADSEGEDTEWVPRDRVVHSVRTTIEEERGTAASKLTDAYGMRDITYSQV